MKRLKLKLADDKIYTFTTFTIREMQALRNLYKDVEELEEEMDKNRFEYEGGKLKLDENKNPIPLQQTEENKENLLKLEDKGLDLMFNVIRKSICKVHTEFKEKEHFDRLADLLDMQEVQKIFRFCSSGIYIVENDEIDATQKLDESE